MSLGKVKANLGKSLGKLGFCLGLLSNILEFSALIYLQMKKGE